MRSSIPEHIGTDRIWQQFTHEQKQQVIDTIDLYTLETHDFDPENLRVEEPYDEEVFWSYRLPINEVVGFESCQSNGAELSMGRPVPGFDPVPLLTIGTNIIDPYCHILQICHDWHPEAQQ